MAIKKTEEHISIPAIDIRHATIKVVGDSPLIMHKWSEKAKKEILDKQMKKAKSKGHDAKDPVRDFIDSMYWLEGEPVEKTEEGFADAIKNGARFGFPSVAFKAAAVAAGFRSKVTKDKVTMNGAFHINPELIEIKNWEVSPVAGSIDDSDEKEEFDGRYINKAPSIREDMVRVGMGVADIRYRGMFENWSAVIPIKYNAGVVSLEQLVNLFNLGGFACGLGEWRIEKGGSFGSFHVE